MLLAVSTCCTARYTAKQNRSTGTDYKSVLQAAQTDGADEQIVATVVEAKVGAVIL